MCLYAYHMQSAYLNAHVNTTVYAIPHNTTMHHLLFLCIVHPCSMHDGTVSISPFHPRGQTQSEGGGGRVYGAATFFLIFQCTIYMSLITIIGASLSEPHTSDTTGFRSVRLCMYLCVRRCPPKPPTHAHMLELWF